MTEHVVVGAGPVGTAVARRLADEGAAVSLLSRSGRGPELPGVRRGTRGRPGRRRAHRGGARGGGALPVVNPPRYDQWAEQWPPMTAGFLAAAEATGAVLAMVGNLYPYGPVDGPIREGMPDRAPGPKAKLRAALTAEALDRHAAGRIRTVEVRASDFVGAAADSHLDRVLPRALSGRPVRMIGAVDQPHSWTYVEDVARTLVAAAGTPAAWGRVWHVPTNPPRSQRDAVQDHCRAAGVDPVPVRTVPHLALRAAGLVKPHLAGLEETRYQFVRPYVLDSAAERGRSSACGRPRGTRSAGPTSRGVRARQTADGLTLEGVEEKGPVAWRATCWASVRCARQRAAGQRAAVLRRGRRAGAGVGGPAHGLPAVRTGAGRGGPARRPAAPGRDAAGRGARAAGRRRPGAGARRAPGPARGRPGRRPPGALRGPYPPRPIGARHAAVPSPPPSSPPPSTRSGTPSAPTPPRRPCTASCSTRPATRCTWSPPTGTGSRWHRGRRRDRPARAAGRAGRRGRGCSPARTGTP